ncbi:MAG: hypothetical protein HC915_02290, partial [Anaerolineae bacterium]|nr:hypothetical protein [Anaerolineae bacterium]
MKRAGLLLFLIFPLVGVLGMAFILWNDGRGANEATPLARQYPTPAPLDVTFAPPRRWC